MSHRIIAARPREATRDTIFAWDIETWGLNAKRFVFAVIENVATGEQYVFHSIQETRRFFEDNAPCVCYAHNGSGFDNYSLYSTEELYSARKTASGTKVFEYEINGVKLRDTKHLLPMRLAQLAKSVSMEKGETPEAYIKGTPREVTQQDIDYCRMDVAILAAAIRRLRQLYGELVGRPGNELELPLTTASMAYRVWCIPESWPDSWLWRDARQRWRPIARCRPGFNEIYRKCEHGGRVQVMCEPGEVVQDVVSYDANSLYPSVMYEELFPDPQSVGFVGPTFEALRYELNRKDRVVVADVRMVAPDGVPRFLPNTDEDGRKKWDSNEFDGWLCEPELKLALEVGWIVEEVRQVVSARAMRPFRQYVRRLYDLRLEMRERGDPAHSLCKLLLNSLFGRFGIKERPGRVEGAEEIQKANQREDYDERYELCYYDGIEMQYPYLIDWKQMRKAPSSQWFGFSSFILSYGRERLARAIIAAGDDALYCDTDSVHMRVEAALRFEHETPIGDDLGMWKLETPTPIPNAKYWEPKAYCHMDENMDRLLVKHKGVKVYDDDGSFMPNAGDLTKEQVHRTVVSLYEGLRRKLEPGTPLITKKRSSRFYKETS